MRSFEIILFASCSNVAVISRKRIIIKEGETTRASNNVGFRSIKDK